MEKEINILKMNLKKIVKMSPTIYFTFFKHLDIEQLPS